MKKKRFWVWVLPGLLLICLLSSALSALLNLGLPKTSPVTETLSVKEKARLEESVHLRESLGNAVFPGFGDAPLGQVVYNESYAFVLNLHDPAEGWLSLPAEKQNGTAWEIVPEDYWIGDVYYRQPLKDDVTPQAFAVRIGDSFAGSMTTFDWTRISLIEQFRRDLPSWLRPIFPYQLAVNLLIRGSDMYISLIEHETFHAYQAYWAPETFYPAEKTKEIESLYPWEDESGVDQWQIELKTLQQALNSEQPQETRLLAAQFLQQRETRRETLRLSEKLITYETSREWVEGLARYAELESWRLANLSETYQTVDSLASDPAFRDYKNFPQRWNNEISQMSRMADDTGDGRFYYSGMAQAYLLDKLDPAWKDKLYQNPQLTLEDLLKSAVE